MEFRVQADALDYLPEAVYRETAARCHSSELVLKSEKSKDEEVTKCVLELLSSVKAQIETSSEFDERLAIRTNLQGSLPEP